MYIALLQLASARLGTDLYHYTTTRGTLGTCANHCLGCNRVSARWPVVKKVVRTLPCPPADTLGPRLEEPAQRFLSCYDVVRVHSEEMLLQTNAALESQPRELLVLRRQAYGRG